MTLPGWAKWRLRELTPELAEEIAEAFRRGATVKIAAGLIPVPPGVLRRWLAEGEHELNTIYENGKGQPGECGLLYELCAKAAAEYLQKRVRDVSTADKDSEWRAASWLLERRDDEFNPASRVEVTGEGGGPIAVEGRAVVGLADVLAVARELGVGHLFGLGTGDTRGALPGADEVLPDPPVDQPAAVPLPDVQRS